MERAMMRTNGHKALHGTHACIVATLLDRKALLVDSRFIRLSLESRPQGFAREKGTRWNFAKEKKEAWKG